MLHVPMLIWSVGQSVYPTCVSSKLCEFIKDSPNRKTAQGFLFFFFKKCQNDTL